MTYRYKSACLVFPPAPPPLPSGSVYANPGHPRAAFANAAGEEIALTLRELRGILVEKTIPVPENVPFADLRAAFRTALKLMPHTHSHITSADIAAAYNRHPDDPFPY